MRPRCVTKWAITVFLLSVPICLQAQPQTPTWESLRNDARDAYIRKDYTRAEISYLLALRETERFEPSDERIAETLDGLVSAMIAQKKYEESESLCLRSLAIRGLIYGPESLEYARFMIRLASPYVSHGRHVFAEPLLRRAIEIQQRAMDSAHPALIASRNELARSLNLQRKFDESEPILMQNLAIQEKVAGEYSPALRSTIALLGALYLTQQRWAEAEPFYLRGVEIARRSGDAKMQAFAVNALALLYRRQHRYVEAEQLYVQALDLIERNYGPDDPSLAGILQMYGILLTATHRYDEAARVNARMNELMNKSATQTP